MKTIKAAKRLSPCKPRGAVLLTNQRGRACTNNLHDSERQISHPLKRFVVPTCSGQAKSIKHKHMHDPMHKPMHEQDTLQLYGVPMIAVDLCMCACMNVASYEGSPTQTGTVVDASRNKLETID